MIARAEVDVVVDGGWALVVLVATFAENAGSSLRVHCAHLAHACSLN